MNLIKHLQAQKKWSIEAFGPAEAVDRTEGVLNHIQKEIEEVREHPKDTEEWIDIAMLAFDGAWRNGASPEKIALTLSAKLRKNTAREWPDWRTADPNKAITHKKRKRSISSLDIAIAFSIGAVIAHLLLVLLLTANIIITSSLITGAFAVSILDTLFSTNKTETKNSSERQSDRENTE